MIGDELGNATDIDRLLVYSRLSTPIFTLIVNDDFWGCHADFRPKMSPKIGNLVGLGPGPVCTASTPVLAEGAAMVPVL